MCEVSSDSVHRQCLRHFLAKIWTQENLSSEEEFLIIGIARSIDEKDYKERFEKLKVCKLGKATQLFRLKPILQHYVK